MNAVVRYSRHSSTIQKLITLYSTVRSQAPWILKSMAKEKRTTKVKAIMNCIRNVFDVDDTLPSLWAKVVIQLFKNKKYEL
jgi:hypothetical protein